jgi:4-hydroxy-tetrahydrodipicolinate synthase
MSTLLDTAARGLFAIAATPFREDGALDLDSVEPLVAFYLEHGACGLTILGVMGEAPKLTTAESVAFTRRVLAVVAGRVPVVVGVTAPGFATMRELTDLVIGEGASGVMVAPPATARTDGAILQYFQQAADALGRVPFVLQDYPQLTGVQMPPSVIRRIVETITSCVMVKHEDWPGLAKLTALRDPPPLRRVSILTGNNGLFLPEELRRGADGAMTGFSFPEMSAQVIAAHEAGDTARAAELHDAYLPLLRYEHQPTIGLAVRKYVLAKRGAIAFATQRPPRSAFTRLDVADVELLLERQSRRLAALR